MSDIHFDWAGKKYTVKAAAYNKDYIVLPNRKVVRPTEWWKGMGYPVLLKVEEVTHHLEHQSVGEIAEHFGNAILAHEAE